MYISNLSYRTLNKKKLKKSYGRNNQGKITVRYRKKGHKKLYRFLNNTNKFDSDKIIISIEYDPNRNVFLANTFSKSKNKYIKEYILSTNGMNVLQMFKSTNNQTGLNLNNLHTQAKNLSIGDIISNIEVIPGKGAIFAKSAGCFGQVVKLSDTKKGLVQIRLPSKEQYFIFKESTVMKGRMSNLLHKQLKKWKAGTSNNLGINSKVRGVAKNPIDHPHGGGEGKGYIGRPPVTPQGRLTKGVPTRKKRKNSFFIALSRKKLK